MDNDKLFSLEMLENSDNSILNRIADQVSDEDTVSCSASHSSHSSSSGRGHSSHVSYLLCRRSHPFARSEFCSSILPSVHHLRRGPASRTCTRRSARRSP